MQDETLQEIGNTPVKETPKEKAQKKIDPILSFLSVMIFFGLIVLVSSVFVWIWATFALAWKIFLTGLAMIVIGNFLYKIFEKSVENL